MPSNYLEELIIEWYEYQGYFVRNNILVGKRKKGGYETELDIVAFHPEKRHLVHIEPSMDADSWSKRETRYSKKFNLGRKYIPELFKGLNIPDEIEQIAVFVFASKSNHKTIGGGKILLLNEIIKDIIVEINGKRIQSNAISEHMPLIRTLQFVCEYGKYIKEFL